jgi:hypothetical protein
MASLDDIRKKLMEQESKRSGKSNKKFENSDNSTFPFWNVADGEESVLRFIPDKDTNNTFFWAEREMINIPFSGVIGAEDEDKPVTVTVPCVEMWGRQCPIHQEIRPWYKQNDKELEKLASVYWKKRSYLLQGFVRKTKLVEDNAPENPIRKFWLKPQVFNMIKAILLDQEVTTSPTDFEGGLDFKIIKGKKGNFADYSTSQWSRNSSPLTQEERDAISTHGLYNLADYLPKQPTEEETAVIFDMFNVSLEGGKYDPVKWGKYFRPKGVMLTKDAEQASPSTQQAVRETTVTVNDTIPFTETVQAQVSEPVVASTTSEQPKVQTANDILAMLKNRKTA